jgi:ribosomal protein L29
MEMTTSKFVDQYAVAAAQLKALQKTVDDLKAKLLALGATEIAGDKFALKVTTYETSRLDTATVKTFLTEAQIAEATKTSTSTRITVAARANQRLTA